IIQIHSDIISAFFTPRIKQPPLLHTEDCSYKREAIDNGCQGDCHSSSEYCGTSNSSLLSTMVTPGACHAATSASSLSANERTVPRRITVPPTTSAVIFSASMAALRRKTSLIFC